MFAKIVTALLFVWVLPCESRHQQFVEVPFDDGASTHETQQFSSQQQQPSGTFGGSSLNEKPRRISHVNPNQHFASSEQQFQGSLHNHEMHNKHIRNPIVTRSRPQSTVNGEELLRSAVLRAQLQDAGRLSVGQQNSDFHPTNQVSGSTGHFPSQNFPPTPLNSFHGLSSSSSFSNSQPIHQSRFDGASTQSIHNQGAVPSQSQQFDPTLQFGSNSPSDYQLLNSVARAQPSRQPASTFLGVEEPTVRFIGQPKEESRQPSEDITNVAHFLTRQPSVRAPIAPPPQPIFNSQFSQPNQQRVSQNPRFPERPELLINAQPQAPAPVRFLVNHASAPAFHEQARRPNSNTGIQTQVDREEEIFKQQAANAKYSFASQVDDSINGNQHQREEVRDGLNVKGMYSYSDGYVKRTVFYEADDKGYRVVKEEEEPLGNGPQINPKGHANVSSYVAGNAVQYSITADDIQEKIDGSAQGNSFGI